MKPQTIHSQDTQTGKISLTSDDVGLWLETDNGEECVEILVTLNDLDTLRHAILLNKDKIREAELPKVASHG